MTRFLVVAILSLTCLTTTLVGQEYEIMPPDEIKEIIQLAVDLPELQQYFHVDVDSSRIPLTIERFGLINAENLKGIEKFGRPLRVLDEEALRLNPVKAALTVSDWTHLKDKLRLQLYYQVEGIIINYMFHKKDGKWLITNSAIFET